MTTSSSSGRRTTIPYVMSSEKNTTLNRTTASAPGTPDFSHIQLLDLTKDSPESEKVVTSYSFKNPSDTRDKDSVLNAPNEKDRIRKM